jgi:hypothetical protein
VISADEWRSAERAKWQRQAAERELQEISRQEALINEAVARETFAREMDAMVAEQYKAAMLDEEHKAIEADLIAEQCKAMMDELHRQQR